MRGAGGTDGGVGSFLLGVTMLIGGSYLFLDNVYVDTGMGWGGGAMYHMGGMGITSGMILIPFMLGVAMVFYSAKNPLGWLLTFGSVVALVFGIISRVQMRFADMTLFSLLTIIVLMVGGAGLLLNAMRERKPKYPDRLR